MAEVYDVAAWRHYRTAEILQDAGQGDDASYHFGITGETALKSALRVSGCEAAWIAAGTKLKNTPMRGHFHQLGDLVQSTALEIGAFASGRLAQPIAAYVLNPAFQARFQGWHIDIRYADPDHTPVSAAKLDGFQRDAEDLLLALVI